MSYKITILSKEECIIFTSKPINNKVIIISINDSTTDTVFHANTSIIDTLPLYFDDIEIPLENHKTISTPDALAIRTFIDKYKKDVDEVVIHCTAGISRSGAIGLALSTYLNGSDTLLINSGKYLPNKLVYKTMCQVLELDFTDKLYKNKLRRCRKSTELFLGKLNADYGINIDDMFKEDYF